MLRRERSPRDICHSQLPGTIGYPADAQKEGAQASVSYPALSVTRQMLGREELKHHSQLPGTIGYPALVCLRMMGQHKSVFRLLTRS